MMKKYIIVGILVFIVAIALGGLYISLLNKKEQVTLKVIEKYWIGEKDFKDNDPLAITYTVKKGDKIKAKRFDTGYVFTIEKITKNAVYIKSNKPISGTDKGVDLRTKETEYVIKSGKKLELTEPSMDAGNIYIFEIVE